MRGNAELAVLDRQVAEAAARAALARAQQVPDPTVEGAVTHDAPGEFVWGWRYAVGITVPLFTRHRAAVRVEEATLAQLRAQREALVQKIEGAVGAAVAQLGTIRAVVAATGTADPLPGADWIIIAPQPARVAVITKAEGDRVRKGELLVRFDAPPLRADLATRSGELAAARARLE